jgi:hypothetical protein
MPFWLAGEPPAARAALRQQGRGLGVYCYLYRRGADLQRNLVHVTDAQRKPAR